MSCLHVDDSTETKHTITIICVGLYIYIYCLCSVLAYIGNGLLTSISFQTIIKRASTFSDIGVTLTKNFIVVQLCLHGSCTEREHVGRCKFV